MSIYIMVVHNIGDYLQTVSRICKELTQINYTKMRMSKAPYDSTRKNSLRGPGMVWFPVQS